MAEQAERSHRRESRNETAERGQVSQNDGSAVQRRDERRDAQAALLHARPTGPQPLQRRVARNQTGLPDRLKAGIEALSGVSLDDVRVHRNSPKPSRLDALAYAQGGEIHLAPGQERHLPHEAWHVVQQAQGRVSPTRQMKGGVAINDDAALEREADRMGAAAVAMQGAGRAPDHRRRPTAPGAVQRKISMADGKEFQDARNAPAIIEAIRAAGLEWRPDLGKTLSGWLNKGEHGPFDDLAALLTALTAARDRGGAINQLGRAREEAVAAATRGSIADDGRYGQDRAVHLEGSDRHVKLDAHGPNFYAIVGGAAKARNLEKFAAICRDLAVIAAQDKKEPRVYCTADTPDHVVETARAIVGENNVYMVETGRVWGSDDGSASSSSAVAAPASSSSSSAVVKPDE